MYNTILVAVDLSDESKLLLKKAAELSHKFDAQCHTIYVEPGVGQIALMDIDLGLEELHQKTMETHQKQMGELCKAAELEPASSKTTEGDIAGHIVDAAENISADLLIMGEHHSFWRMQHTNRKVQKELNCDILTVPLN